TDSATAGIVSALNRTITSPNNSPITNAIQTDAAINHGNSGGPLLNTDGQVVGITSQIYADSNTSGNVGIGFVVPSNTVRSVMSQLIATGKVSRPFVGVYLADVDQATAQATGLPVGAEITKVAPGSPAARAGLKAATGQRAVQGEQFPTGGDVITKVDGSTVTSADDVINDVLQHKPGDTLSLTIVRDGHEQTVTVTLGSRS
ncbi:MAG TPA: PDZ domain-containing protein, partial [Gaiellales bacterium]|nr:PDZ domain-containing protein [Gaiellales bacterium]